MNISFKKKLSLQYLTVSAIIFVVTFLLIHIVVHRVVDGNIDKRLLYEVNDHLQEIVVENDSVRFSNTNFKTQKEHIEEAFNPVFIQISNLSGQTIGKSPNLKSSQLDFFADQLDIYHFESTIEGKPIRAVQFPIVDVNQKKKAFYTAAVSLEEINKVINTLNLVLLLSYPVLLLILFISARILAGNNIKTLRTIVNSAKEFTEKSIYKRIPVPESTDEIKEIFTSFNFLLDKMESVLNKEKQFTSFASHELRTPLTAIQGHLEILIRKPREIDEYESKIKYCLSEIQKISEMVDQLLLLARMEKNDNMSTHLANLGELIKEEIEHCGPVIDEKEIKINFQCQGVLSENVFEFTSRLILGNIINNAIKYSREKGEVSIQVRKEKEFILVQVIDTGIGIKTEDLPFLYQPFFRAKSLAHKKIKGSGLGMTIANQAAEQIGAEISLESQEGVGTQVSVKFKRILRES